MITHVQQRKHKQEIMLVNFFFQSVKVTEKQALGSSLQKKKKKYSR